MTDKTEAVALTWREELELSPSLDYDTIEVTRGDLKLLIAAALRPQEAEPWISVEDQTAPPGEWLLVMASGYPDPWVAMHTERGWEGPREYHDDWMEVTHWRNMPAPPNAPDRAHNADAPGADALTDWPEERVDIIGQNGNDGDHYGGTP